MSMEKTRPCLHHFGRRDRGAVLPATTISDQCVDVVAGVG
jgi:hypothetical protein